MSEQAMPIAHFCAVAIAFGVLVCRARHISAESLWTVKLQHGQLAAAVLGTLIAPATAAVVVLCLAVALYFGLGSIGPWALARHQAARQQATAANVIPFSSNATATANLHNREAR